MLRYLLVLISLFTYFSISAQVCVSLDDWSFAGDNGDGTCDYDVVVIVNSGNGSSGSLTLSIAGDPVFTGTCTCNPGTIGFTVTVPCNSDIEIEGFWDGPGNGNDCMGTTGTFSLPVSWKEELAAEVKGESVLLSFATAQEYNTSHFEIQHSQGSDHDFVVLETLSGQGDSKEATYYNYEHQYPAGGVQYYRLLQVDTDGRSAYSRTVSAVVDAKFSNIAYPNPATTTVTLSSKATGQCYIYDQMGRTLTTITSDGHTAQRVDISGYPAGVYIVRYADGTHSKLRKL